MNVSCCNTCEIPLHGCAIHTHKSWEIILNLTGNVTSVIGDTAYDIQPGDVMIVPPNTGHDGHSKGLYTDMFVQADILDFSDVFVVHDYDGSIKLLMELLQKVTTEKEDGFEKIADSLLESICGFIEKYAVKKYKFGFVNTLKYNLYQNISNSDYKIAEQIKSMGYNIDYIRRCFKAETGKTPAAHLTDLRLSKARRLLLQESFVSIADVAAQCGYNDSFYFSSIFKKHTGLSPRDYRKAFMK